MARKKRDDQHTRRLFRESEQQDMWEKSYEEELAERKNQPVESLGMTFENDDARREHFLGLLREGLEELHAKLGGVPFTTVEDAVERMKSITKWPMEPRINTDGHESDTSNPSASVSISGSRLRELAERMRHADSSKDLLQRWKDEVGFPHGEIEDILNLSDPPYYTACPNPFIADFIKQYGKPYNPENDDYRREPFAVDVSVGKTDPIYKAHSYHTKVPHLAIVPSILHYTEPGDVVLDGFQWCGSAPENYKREIEALWEKEGRGKPKWGTRRVVLGDLAPAATFIAANYNLPFDVNEFAQAARKILDEVEQEIGWMYETLHTDGKTKGRIEYTVWSEVFTCPDCAGEVVFLNEALDADTKRVRDIFPCPHCGSELTKNRMERRFATRFDAGLKTTVRLPMRRPSIITYKVGKHHYEKTPDEHDLKVIDGPNDARAGQRRLLGRQVACRHRLFLACTPSFHVTPCSCIGCLVE